MPGALICEAMDTGRRRCSPVSRRKSGPHSHVYRHGQSPLPLPPSDPGDQLVTKAVIKKIVGRMGKVHCECYVGETFKASADFLFYLAEPENKKEKDENNK